jgi:acylphosphatase
LVFSIAVTSCPACQLTSAALAPVAADAPRELFRSGQHNLTTVIFSSGQTDFSKKRKKFFPARCGGERRQVASISDMRLAGKNPAAGHLPLVTRLPFWLHPEVPVKPQASAPASSRSRLNIFYSGRVQGVGFRYSAKSVAAGFEVTGTIRNLPDGRVELVAEGARTELDAFRAAILAEGLAGFIRDEQVSWAAAQNEFRGFEIVR